MKKKKEDAKEHKPEREREREIDDTFEDSG